MKDLSKIDFSTLEYDEIGVRVLAGLFKDVREIANFFDQDIEDVEEEYGALIHRVTEEAKLSVITRQWEMAREGNIEMLRHLGVRHCGQKDQG